MKNSKMAWYNYKKRAYEYIDTPTDFSDYIPDIPAAQSMYNLYIKI